MLGFVSFDSKRGLRRGGLALGLFVAGCASSPSAPRVFVDGPGTASAWQRAETEHFVIESNASGTRQVERIARELETLWGAFADLPVLGMQPPEGKSLVVLLRKDAEFRYVAGDWIESVFYSDTPLGTLVLMPPQANPLRSEVVKHQLALLVSSTFLGSAPEWLLAGLGQVMQTARYEESEGEIVFGEYSPGLLFGAGSNTKAEEFLSPWPELGALERAYYDGKSWLLVHYLIDNELQGFLDLLVRVSQGEDWRRAWEAELFLSLAAVDDALGGYLREGRFGLWKADVRAPEAFEVTISPVSTADALALRCVLELCAFGDARSADERAAAFEADYEAASRLEPENARLEAVRRYVAAPSD